MDKQFLLKMERFSVFVIFFLIVSCGKECEDEFYNSCRSILKKENTGNIEYDNFYKNYAKWRCSQIEKYQYIYTSIYHVSCTGVDAFIAVDSDIIIDTLTSNLQGFQEDFCKTENYTTYYTIDELFIIIQAAVDGNIVLEPYQKDDPDQTTADVVMVDYHPIYGFPVRCSIDYVFGIADDEFGFEIRDFMTSQ